MPRSPRGLPDDGFYHLTSRGNGGAPIVRDDYDRRRLLEHTSIEFARADVPCLAYCLMTNHFHFLVEARGDRLSTLMHRLNGGYAAWFNRRHDCRGHMFGDRFHHRPVASDWHLAEASRYIVLNPVRAALCRSPGGWPWSSYRASVGLAEPEPFLAPDLLLRFFGRTRASAFLQYERFVAEG